MRRALVAAVALAAGALTGDAAPVPARAQPVGDGVPAGIQDLLDRRETAVREGDESAFMATVDQQASDTFRNAQRTLFAGLRSVPLEKYELEARFEDSGDLGPAAAHEYGGASVSLPETRQRIRIRGFDEVDEVDALWLTYVRRGDQWYVADDSDVADLGIETTRGLWDGGPVVTVASEHFLVLTHPGQEERARALSAIAEEALGRLDQVWKEPWSRKLPIVLPASIEELQGILQSSVDLTKFVAFVAYGSVREDGYEITAPRMYIQDRNLARYGRGYQLETLVHELAHAAQARLSGPFIPAWVHEGVADWLARGRPAGERRRGGDSTFPRDFEFGIGSGAAITRAYDEARTAISTLGRLAGSDAPAALFTALGAVREEPGDADHHLDAVLRRVAGMGVPDLEARWGQ